MPGIHVAPRRRHSSALADIITQLQNSLQALSASSTSGLGSALLALVKIDTPSNGRATLLQPLDKEQDAQEHITSFKTRLTEFEEELKEHGQWHPSNIGSAADAPRDESLVIFDLDDLQSTMALLNKAVSATISSWKPQSAHAYFVSRKWLWDSEWHEFYSNLDTPQQVVYLSRWRLDSSTNKWDLVTPWQLGADEASAQLTPWEDWCWDEEWEEWYFPIAHEQGTLVEAVYASAWRMNGNGEWRYVDVRSRW